MRRSWKLGTAFGIGIYVHWTFLLLPAYVLFSNLGVGGLELALYMVGLVVALFGCVVLHELGHALMARRFGIPTRDITLYPIGGVARLERMSERPWEEFWIALAGPAVNVVIAGLLALTLRMVDLARGAEALLLPTPGNFVLHLLLMNLFLVLFNLLPAFPMDGGRVLRALLALGLGRLRATEIAARVGAVMAGILVFQALGLPLLPFLPSGSIPMLLVAGFVFLVGQQELGMVRYIEARRQAEPLDAVPVDAEILDAVPVSPQRPFSGMAWDSRLRAWVVWQNGRPVHAYWVD
jgi:Zn-dependent protease